MSNPTCETCRYCDDVVFYPAGYRGGPRDEGTCRMVPPDARHGQPKVDPRRDWCGEHQPKAPE